MQSITDEREILHQLGKRLKQLRDARQLTLDSLAQKAGVSASYLSQLERGQGNPSFMTLVKLAQALEIETNDLFADGDPSAAVVVARDARVKIKAPGRGVFAERITSDGLAGLEVLLAEYEPSSIEETPYSHRGAEVMWVAEGSFEFHYGNRVYLLNEGDAISFRGEIPHWARNPGDTIARVLMIIVR